jgi:hypothetical protein
MTTTTEPQFINLLLRFLADEAEPGQAMERIKLALGLDRANSKTLRAIERDLRERGHFPVAADYVMDLADRAKRAEDIENLAAAFHDEYTGAHAVAQMHMRRRSAGN